MGVILIFIAGYWINVSAITYLQDHNFNRCIVGLVGRSSVVIPNTKCEDVVKEINEALK